MPLRRRAPGAAGVVRDVDVRTVVVEPVAVDRDVGAARVVARGLDAVTCAHALTPGGVTSAQVRPPSRVSRTRPSSVPAHTSSRIARRGRERVDDAARRRSPAAARGARSRDEVAADRLPARAAVAACERPSGSRRTARGRGRTPAASSTRSATSRARRQGGRHAARLAAAQVLAVHRALVLLPYTTSRSRGSSAMLPLSPPAVIGRQSRVSMPRWSLRARIIAAPLSCCAP